MDDLKKKGIAAFLWDFGGKFANLGVKFVISIFLTRLLEPEEFGLIGMVTVIVSLASVFSNMGLSASLIQRKRLLPVHYNSVFYFNLSVSALLSILLFFAAPLVAVFYDRPELIAITQVLSVIFIINGTTTVQKTFLKKRLKNEFLTKAQFISAVSSGVIGVLLAYMDYGVWALVVQSILSGTINSVMLWFFSGWRPQTNFSFKALKQLWGYGFNLFLSSLLDTIYTQLDVLFIGKLFTPALLGFYIRAKSLNQMVVTFSSGSLMGIFFPVLSSVQNDNERFVNIVDKAYKIINWVVFLIIGLLFLSSYDIIVILFTEEWLPSLPIFRVLLVGAFGYPLSAILVNVVASKGNSAGFLQLEIIKKVLVSFSFVAFFIWGLWGFLYTQLFMRFLGLYVNMHYAKREIRSNVLFFVMPFVKNLLLALVLVLPIYLFIPIKNVYLHAVVVTVLFLIGYVALSHLFKNSGYRLLVQELKNRKKKI